MNSDTGRIVRHYIILAAVEVLVLGLVWYLALPAWNVHSVGMWFYLALAAFIPMAGELSAFAKGKDKFHATTARVFACILAAILLVLAVGGLSSSHLFNAERYRDLISISDGVFADDVPLVENAGRDIPIVDKTSAGKLGDRTLGEMDKVSQFEVSSTYKLVIYQGLQYRLAPLEYGGFFKFNENSSEGVPGYVLVNTVTQEARLVQRDSGMKYIPSAYWSRDLSRHLRTSFPTYLFGQAVFEIDEEGHGYYVVPVEQVKVGLFGGRTIESVILVDTETGELTEYALDQVPEWVDVIYSAGYVMSKIYDHYRYVHGFFNFSHTDERRTSYDYNDESDNFDGYVAMVSNGEVVYFTGVTSAGNDESILGFLMISSRTGEAKFYQCPGAEESSAQRSAEGIVQNWGYSAGYPMMLNVDGVETYFVTLKDASNLVKKYALVNVRNYNVSVAADTIPQAIAEYRALIKGEDVPDSSAAGTKSGVLLSVRTAEIAGYTYYYYSFDGDDTLYKSSILISDLQVTVIPGDTVELEYSDTDDPGIKNVTAFRVTAGGE